MFTDSHCHLTYPGLADRIDQVLLAMQQAGVSRALCICTTLEEFEAVHALALQHAPLWATVGVHPDNEGVQEPDLEALLQRAARPRVLGIGETGLDYYRIGSRSRADMHWQRERFRRHIEAAQQVGKPLIIHCRSAADDTLAILREMAEDGRAGAAGGVFHCFTETLEVARAALDLGFHLSFSGILTFRNAHDLRQIAAFAPIERTLIETDSPYLAPVPYRGKTNMPAYVALVAEQLASIKNLRLEQVAAVTSANFDRLFGLAPTQ